MNKTISKVALVVLTIVIFALLSLLPIFPLLVEGREFSSEGESLYQEWNLVSLRDYYEYSRFAKVAWMDSTRLVYGSLLFVHSLILIFVSVNAARPLVKLWSKRITRGAAR